MKFFASISLLSCAAILAGVMSFDFYHLPPRIASHFNGSGIPNGWMSTSLYTIVMFSIGIGVPAIISGIMYSFRFFPPSLLNVPHPEYWRLPHNFRRACDYLFCSSLWLSSFLMLWTATISHAVAKANALSSPRLNGTSFAILVSLLLLFTTGWIAAILLHFSKTNTVEQDAAANP